ncbi:MAG: hypothetical protein ACREC0_11645, partial [Methylocella sp.]
PGKIAIVPAQAGPQLQRAARTLHLSRAAMADTTAPGGTGFSKIVQSSIVKFAAPGQAPKVILTAGGRLCRKTLTRGIFAWLAPLAMANPLPTSTLRGPLQDARAACAQRG